MHRIICDTCGKDMTYVFATVYYQDIECHFCCFECIESFIKDESQKYNYRPDIEFGKEN